MPYILGVLVVLVGGGYLLSRLIDREIIEYPDPSSLVIEPQSLLPLDQRIFKLEGGVNFRDIGGYPTQDGRTTKSGLVYRSGTLARLSQADWERIDQLGIKLVCDMRSDEEVEADPENLPEGVEYYRIPLIAENQSMARLRMLLFNRRKIATLLPDAYIRVMIENNPMVFGNILRRLADPENLPAVIHCTAGKDRTGVAMALLLILLGVDDDRVVADYTLSNYYYDFFYQVAEVALKPIARMGFDANDVQPLLHADASTMRLMLSHIRQNYGSVQDYLQQKAGIDDETINRLRANLLE